jgi:alcohol dehydrogenase class IV
MCDGIALEGIRLIVEALPKAYKDGKDVEARGKMLVAAAMGAVAFQKDLGLVHSMAHPLSTICGLHHGLANALCLVAGMKFCAARKPGLYRRVGTACGLEIIKASDTVADRQTIRFISGLLTNVGLNTRLGEHGVKAEHLSALVAQAVEDPCHKTNAVPVAEDDFRRLYEEVM